MQDLNDDQHGFYHIVVAKVMRRTAATTTQTDNVLTKRARKWKKDQGIISQTLGEMEELIKSKNLRIIAEQKVDGQSAIMEFADGVARFASLHDRVYDDLPVLDEIASTLKTRGVKHALMVGEMAVSDNGKIVPFEESQSVIKGADRDKTRIHWYPYQILEINGEEHGEGFETYLKGWKLIKDLFKGTQRVHPVESSEGGVPELQAAWKKMVEQEQNEGLVVRTSDGRVYKCKPEFTYDLVVVAVGDKKLKNWPRGLIGSTLMAFMDSDKVFRVAGEVGTGWTQAERGDLFKWAQQNKVGEDDRYVWVKPEKVMEVQYDRSVVRDVTSYRFSGGTYEKVEKRLGGTIIKPRFIRWRDDKKVTPEDLRLTQIPGWKETRTAAMVMRIIAKSDPVILGSDSMHTYYRARFGDYWAHTSGMDRRSDYPSHPNDIVLPGSKWNPKKYSEKDVWTFYEGVKNRIFMELDGKDVFIGIVPKGYKEGQKPVYVRHPYGMHDSYIHIDSLKDFEKYHGGRIVEYHPTTPRLTPFFLIDIDAPGEFSETKKVVADVSDTLSKVVSVREIEIRYTGKRGFHVLGWLKRSVDVDQARIFLKEWLKNNFGKREDVVLGESPQGNKPALGLSPMKTNGGQIGKWSMRVTGLCCIEIPRIKLMSFRREDATIEKVFRMATGRSFPDSE